MWLLDVSGRLLRETVLGIACQMGSPETLNEAAKIFDQWINGQIRYKSCGLSVVNFPYSHSIHYFKVTNGSVYSSSMCIIGTVEIREDRGTGQPQCVLPSSVSPVIVLASCSDLASGCLATCVKDSKQWPPVTDEGISCGWTPSWPPTY